MVNTNPRGNMHFDWRKLKEEIFTWLVMKPTCTLSLVTKILPCAEDTGWMRETEFLPNRIYLLGREITNAGTNGHRRYAQVLIKSLSITQDYVQRAASCVLWGGQARHRFT